MKYILKIKILKYLMFNINLKTHKIFIKLKEHMMH